MQSSPTAQSPSVSGATSGPREGLRYSTRRHSAASYAPRDSLSGVGTSESHQDMSSVNIPQLLEPCATPRAAGHWADSSARPTRQLASGSALRPPTSPRRSRRLASSAVHESRVAAIQESSTQPETRKRKAPPLPSPVRKRAARKKPPPSQPAKEQTHEEDRKPAAVESGKEIGVCCICMCEPEREEEAKINGCDHLFCFECIGKWADRENTCPLCKSRFTSISRVHKIKRRKGEKRPPKNSKKVRPRDQRADIISGPAIEAMLASIASASGRGGPAPFSRVLLAMGGPRRAPSAAAAPRRAGRTHADGGLSADDFFGESLDDDEGDMPMIDLSRLIRQTVSANARRSNASVGFSFSVTPQSNFSLLHALHSGIAPAPFPPPPPARTYASNSSEQDAGTSANPLAIDLDDDDDSVEVLPPLV